MSSSKFENFWYYHKVKVILAVICIIGLVCIIKFTAGKNAGPDVAIAYVTDGRTVPEEVEDHITLFLEDAIEDVNNDKIKNLDFVPLMGPRIDLEFVAEGSEIVLMDGGTLRKLINTGVFEPLDNQIGRLKLDLESIPEVNAKLEGEKEKHFYAIPMRHIPFFLDLGFPSDDYYLTIRSNNSGSKLSVAQSKNAQAVVDAILGYSP